jgi:hypothetical protein
LKNGVFVFDFHRNLRNDVLNCDVLDDEILDLADELLNSGGSLNNGDQGSANDRWRVDGNWCRIRNWRLNSGPLRFRGSRSLNRCGSRSLNWSLNWN